MKSKLAFLVAAFGMVATGPALASGDWSGRGGLIVGTFDYSDRYIDQGCCGGALGSEVPGASFDYDDTNYGLTLGTKLGVEWFFFDYGMEYTTYASSEEDLGRQLYRTDNLFTVGAYIDRWTLFGGYRLAKFGDGFFSDETGNEETGPFFGAGVAFRPGKKIALGISLGYNIIEVTFPDATATDADQVDVAGLSAKFQLNVLDTPHSVYLRYQRFEGDSSHREASGFNYDYEYEENYLNLGYQATFDFATW